MKMTILSALVSTLVSSDEFVEEQLSFSTADVKRIEFYGETAEFHGALAKLGKQPQRFRLIDRELFAVDEERLPPGAQPLAVDAGVFRIIGLRME
ncbi:MAG: hypothetical protein AB1566_04850 [Chloroflexota bacterium]